MALNITLDSNMAPSKKRNIKKKSETIKLHSMPISNGYFAFGSIDDAFIVLDILDGDNYEFTIEEDGTLLITELQ